MSCVLFSDLTEDYSPGDSLSVALRSYSKEETEEPAYTVRFCSNKQTNKNMQWNIKRLLLITKKTYLKLMIVFSYVWEDAKVWAH